MKTLIFLFIFLSSNIFAQNAGTTGYSFLKIGIGAAELSLSEATSARFNSPFSLTYNPALLSESSISSIGLMHNEWIKDLRTEFLIGNSEVFGIPFFIAINSTRISQIEIRTRPGEPEGFFDAHYFFGGIGTALNLWNELSAGIQFKYLYENIYVDESNGYAFDFGLFKRNLIENVNAGISLRNFGKVNKLSSESTQLPSEIRFGISYSGDLSLSMFRFYPSFDIQKFWGYDKIGLLLGIESIYDNLISIRLGFNSARDLNNFSFGLGLKYKLISFDYALIPFKENFGNANVLSISLKL